MLTQRETEVLQLLALGLKQKGVADALGLAPGTLKVHAHHILKDMKCSNMPQAVYKAASIGLIPLMRSDE
jgi:DNA-binding NarL/FixJ family response regulator